MSFGTLEINFVGPMMLPDLHFGTKNRPERTAECPPGKESGPRGTKKEPSGNRGAKVWIIAESSSKTRGATPPAAST